jgi:flagellar biogenesis protein FliO
MGHGASSADAQGVRLPAQETYAVQQDSPLFAQSQTAPTQAAQPQSASLGVQEPATGFDFVDVGIKLAAVLGLAYGSLALLKRSGMGGASAAKSGTSAAGMKVVSSLALAPNRTVHVISVPGGKSLLLGATPTQVNLIADLGQVEVETADAAAGPSLLGSLSHKLGR